MMKLVASRINIHHIRSICPDEGLRRDAELHAHTHSTIQLVGLPAIQHHVGGWKKGKLPERDFDEL